MTVTCRTTTYGLARSTSITRRDFSWAWSESARACSVRDARGAAPGGQDQGGDHPVGVGGVEVVGEPAQGVVGLPAVVQPDDQGADLVGDQRRCGPPGDPDGVGDRLAGGQGGASERTQRSSASISSTSRGLGTTSR